MPRRARRRRRRRRRSCRRPARRRTRRRSERLRRRGRPSARARPGRAAPGRGRPRLPAASAAAALVPLIVPYRADLSSFRPMSAVTSSTPGAVTSGFTPPPNARPCEEKSATRRPSGLSAQPGAPSETVTSAPRAIRRRASRATAAGRPDDRDVDPLVEAERAGGHRAVDDDGLRARERRPAAGLGRCR